MTDMSFNYVIPASGSGTIVDVALGVTSGITINWGDSTTTPVTDGIPIVTYGHTYPASALPITYTITISGTSLGSFGVTQESPTTLRGIQYLTSVGSFGTLGITNFTNAFYGATSLTSVPSTLPSSVTNIRSMFRNASVFNQDISGWVVNNVTNMFGVFSGATIFNQNISTWNVTNVNTMRFMFFGSNFNQNIILNEPIKWSEKIKIPEATAYTAPYWLVNKGTLGLYNVENQEIIGDPETKRSLTVTFELKLKGKTINYTKEVVHKYNSPENGETYRPLEIVPPLSVKVKEPVYIFSSDQTNDIKVTVHAWVKIKREHSVFLYLRVGKVFPML
jgi:hypothetical protein